MAQVADRSGAAINGDGSSGSREWSGRATPSDRGRAVPRVTLTRAEAAASLGISIDSFERHVQPELRIIRRGRMRLIPVVELERWAAANATLTLDEPIR
jgi:hypothetical protein